MNIQTSGRTTSDAGNGWASLGIAKESGGNLAFYTSTVSGTSGFFGSFQWEEVPV